MGLSYQKTCSINPNISLLTTGSLKPPKEWQMHCLNVWSTCRPEAIILGAAVAIRCFLESASMDGSKCKAPCSSRSKLAKIYDCFIVRFSQRNCDPIIPIVGQFAISLDALSTLFFLQLFQSLPRLEHYVTSKFGCRIGWPSGLILCPRLTQLEVS